MEETIGEFHLPPNLQLWNKMPIKSVWVMAFILRRVIVMEYYDQYPQDYLLPKRIKRQKTDVDNRTLKKCESADKKKLKKVVFVMQKMPKSV